MFRLRTDNLKIPAGILTLLLLAAGGWALCAPKPPLLDGIPFSTLVLDRHGGLMRLSLAEDGRYRVYTPLEEIAPHLLEATLLYEDRYFRLHPGVNIPALLRAAWNTLRGRRMGASTITMQLARLRLRLDTSGIGGKLRQIERALAYELHYSKRDILEAYFNLAPYGGNIEGCGAASRIYYHKTPQRLNLTEALSLAGVPQNPSGRNPLARRKRGEEPGSRPGPAALETDGHRERLFRLWLREHPEDAGSAFLSRAGPDVYAPADLPFTAPHVAVEAVARYGGRRTPVKTTLDLRLQRRLEELLGAMLRRNAGLGVNNAAALLVHWPSMETRALVGSADFFNPEIEGQVDGSRARRSPGSTLKPFIYALALDQGLIHPHSLLYDTPRSFEGYDPENADQEFRGPLSASAALRLSRNIPAVNLARRLGQSKDAPDLYAFLREAGVPFAHGREHYGLTLVLGGAELSMRELASLYALLARRGTPEKLLLFEQDKDRQPTAPPRRLLSPEACVLTLNMLRALPPAQSLYKISTVRRVPMYWKTGTSNGLRDAWTAGIFGPYVLVIWVGNFNNRPNQAFMGARIAAPLFWETAEAIYALENLDDTPMRDLEELNIARVRVCGGTGDLDTSLCPDVVETLFIPGVSPIENSGVYRRILLDKASGMRACVDVPGRTERVVWEFWPTDLQQVFRRAGIMKPAPPPFLPECAAADNVGGRPPAIISPKSGVLYHRSLSRPQGTVLTLHAAGDADAADFFWFADGSFIGRSKPGEHLVWTPPGGLSTIRVVDNFGRSDSRNIRVELTE
ncbi:MAG: penicillin-binding protein 1C [Deltaproteobacteria bacterium]|nr:penicillin-binding protein 1C [Deltaproteobacteria bacterium]